MAQKAREGLFTRSRGNGSKLEKGRFGFRVGRNSLRWGWLPRTAVEAPWKCPRLGWMALWATWYPPHGREFRTRRSPTTQTTVWFYYYFVFQVRYDFIFCFSLAQFLGFLVLMLCGCRGFGVIASSVENVTFSQEQIACMISMLTIYRSTFLWIHKLPQREQSAILSLLHLWATLSVFQ